MSKTTTQEREMDTSPNQSFFIDMGRGDWRLADSPQTRVTTEQLAAINALAEVDDIGASEVRFGDMIGELTVLHTNGRITDVAEDGTAETL